MFEFEIKGALDDVIPKYCDPDGKEFAGLKLKRDYVVRNSIETAISYIINCYSSEISIKVNGIELLNHETLYLEYPVCYLFRELLTKDMCDNEKKFTST